MGQIYKITNIINGKCYIGQTKYAAIERYNSHMSSTKNSYFHQSIKKYGKENFKLEILEDNIDEKDLDRLEIYYIQKFNSFYDGYNQTLGGQGIHGYKFSDEDKKKMSEAGKLAWKSEKRLAGLAERNRKISIANTGKKFSAEHKQKISEAAKLRVGDKNSFYGHTHSTHTKKLISDKNSIPVEMLDENLNIIKVFKNAKVAAKYIVNKYSLSTRWDSVYRRINWRCIDSKNNKFDLYYNYYWKYHKV